LEVGVTGADLFSLTSHPSVVLIGATDFEGGLSNS
jgi:hypothetical protein